MKKALVLLVILAVLIVVSWLIYNNYAKNGGYAVDSPLVTHSPFQTPEVSKEIEVFFPTKDTVTVGTEFIIYGKGRAFENTINYRVSDDAGKQLYLGSFMTTAPDAGIFGYFNQEVDLTKLLTTIPPVILLDVFEASAKDGSDIHKTSFRLNVEYLKNTNTLQP